MTNINYSFEGRKDIGTLLATHLIPATLVIEYGKKKCRTRVWKIEDNKFVVTVATYDFAGDHAYERLINNWYPEETFLPSEDEAQKRAKNMLESIEKYYEMHGAWPG